MSEFWPAILIAANIAVIVLSGYRYGAWMAVATAVLIGFGFFVAFLAILPFEFGCDGNWFKGFYSCPAGVEASLAFRSASLVGTVGFSGTLFSLPMIAVTFLVACLISLGKRR